MWGVNEGGATAASARCALASSLVSKHALGPPACAPGRGGFGGRRRRGWWRCGRFGLDDGGRDRRCGLRRWSGAADQQRRRLTHGRTPSRQLGFRRLSRFTRNRRSRLSFRRFLMVVAVGTVRSGVVCLVRPVVPLLFDRRSTKIRDRVGDFLVDGRNAVLRRPYPRVPSLPAPAPAPPCRPS